MFHNSVSPCHLEKLIKSQSHVDIVNFHIRSQVTDKIVVTRSCRLLNRRVIAKLALKRAHLSRTEGNQMPLKVILVFFGTKPKKVLLAGHVDHLHEPLYIFLHKKIQWHFSRLRVESVHENSVCKASQAMLRIFLATKRYSCIRGRFALVGLQCSGSVLCDSHMLVALEDAIQVYTIYKLRRFSSAKFRSELELRTVRQYGGKKNRVCFTKGIQ